MLAGFRIAGRQRRIAQILLGQKALWLMLTTVLALLGGIKSDHASRSLMTAVQSGPTVIMVYDTDPQSLAKKHPCCSSHLGKLIFIKHKARALTEGILMVAAVATACFVFCSLQLSEILPVPRRPLLLLSSHGLMSTVRLLI